MPMFAEPFAHLLSPPRSHAGLDEDGRCDEHEDPSSWSKTYPKWGRKPRIWRVRDGVTIRADRHARRKDAEPIHLEPWTRLRLDLWWQQGFRDGDFGESGDYWITERRFCVLDGKWAGCCWTNTIIADMWDPSVTDTSDPVEEWPTDG